MTLSQNIHWTNVDTMLVQLVDANAAGNSTTFSYVASAEIDCTSTRSACREVRASRLRKYLFPVRTVPVRTVSNRALWLLLVSNNVVDSKINAFLFSEIIRAVPRSVLPHL